MYRFLKGAIAAGQAAEDERRYQDQQRYYDDRPRRGRTYYQD